MELCCSEVIYMLKYPYAHAVHVYFQKRYSSVY